MGSFGVLSAGLFESMDAFQHQRRDGEEGEHE
jgi:hypothetical protein